MRDKQTDRLPEVGRQMDTDSQTTNKQGKINKIMHPIDQIFRTTHTYILTYIHYIDPNFITRPILQIDSQRQTTSDKRADREHCQQGLQNDRLSENSKIFPPRSIEDPSCSLKPKNYLSFENT